MKYEATTWLTKRRQGDDVMLKIFKLQTIWKQSSNGVLTPITTRKRDLCLSFAYGFGMNTIFTGFKKPSLKFFLQLQKKVPAPTLFGNCGDTREQYCKEK